jgi:hypothetical protein
MAWWEVASGLVLTTAWLLLALACWWVALLIRDRYRR